MLARTRQLPTDTLLDGYAEGHRMDAVHPLGLLQREALNACRAALAERCAVGGGR